MLYPRPCLPERMRAADQFEPTRRQDSGRDPYGIGTTHRRIAFVHIPGQAVTNPGVAECIRYSDLECDSFDWSERFVRLEKMGEGMKENNFLSVFDC